MAEKKYLSRISDQMLHLKLETSGAVLVEGAKWCGKTTTAHQTSTSVYFPDNG